MPRETRSHPSREVSTRGLAYGMAAYGLWGLFPLYWPLLEPAGAIEILACRIVFSLLTVVLILAAGRDLVALRRLSRPSLARLCAAGAIISVNWGLYIWGVNNGHVVETSLGYFINPLMTVALGVVVLGERIRRAQTAAVVLGTAAVVLLTVEYGQPPLLALTLAVSFATYGLIKNRVAAAPLEGLAVEAGVVAVPAVIVLAVLAGSGSATWTGHDATLGHILLLVAAGPVTAVPLLFFAGAARRLPLSTVGLLQYLAPLMQFLIGVLVRHEAMPPSRLAGFALVWAALVVLSADAVRQRRRTGASARAARDDVANEPGPAAGEPEISV